MCFNPDPTKYFLVISINKSFHLFFNNIMVKQVSEHKPLGLTLGSKLTFTNHIVELWVSSNTYLPMYQ